MQRFELAALNDDVLTLLFNMFLDKDLYFFALTGKSIFAVVTRDLFWKHRLKHTLPDEIKKLPFELGHHFFALYSFEKLYGHLAEPQILCFKAARDNDLPKLQSLQQHLTLELCKVQDGRRRTFSSVVRRNGSQEMKQFVFDTVYAPNHAVASVRSTDIAYHNQMDIKKSLIELAIQFNLKEDHLVRLLSKVYDSYDDFVKIAMKLNSLHSLKTLLSFYDNKTNLPYLFHEAVKKGSVALIQLFLEFGADVDLLHHDTTPIATAAALGHIDAILFLLENGADINCGHTTPLYSAMENGHVDVVKLLLAHGAVINAVPQVHKSATWNATNTFWKSLILRAAARNNHLACVGALFEHCEKHHIKLNINDCDDGGGTALFAAAANGHAKMCAYLLQKGAAIEKRYKMATPLYVASMNGHLSVVKVLCEHQAALNYIGPKSASAIHLAAKNGHADIVAYLCTLPHCEIDIVDPDGKTAFLHACWDQKHYKVHWPVAEVLLNYSQVNVNQVDEGGNTAVHYIAHYGTREMMETLIAHTADLNVRDSLDRMPLHVIAEKSSRGGIGSEATLEWIDLFIRSGADPSAECKGQKAWQMLSPYCDAASDYLQKAAAQAQTQAQDQAQALPDADGVPESRLQKKV